MNYTVLSYSLYLVITISLTIWVARTLFKNGSVFLLEIFKGELELAESVNKLLVVGFYLINIGYAVYTLDTMGNAFDTESLIKMLSRSIGLIILILGGMHFFNLFVLFELRKRARNRID